MLAAEIEEKVDLALAAAETQPGGGRAHAADVRGAVRRLRAHGPDRPRARFAIEFRRVLDHIAAVAQNRTIRAGTGADSSDSWAAAAMIRNTYDLFSAPSALIESCTSVFSVWSAATLIALP